MTLAPSQIAIRSTGIGGSEIAKICGISFYQNAGGSHSVWLTKRGLVEPSAGNLATETGDDAEFLAERRYERDTGFKLAPLLDSDGHPITMRHPKHPWVLASIDRVRVHDWIPTEVKFMTGMRTHYFEGNEKLCRFCDRHRFLHWGRESHQVPDDVNAQVQWQMFVCGAPFAEVARFWVSRDGLEFNRYTVPRDDAVIDYLFRTGRDFWENHVLTGVPPDPDPSEESTLCERQFAKNVLRKMDNAPPGTEAHVEAFFDADRMIREGEAKKLEAANWLRRITGHAEGLVGSDYVITNKARKDGARVLKVKKI